MNDTERNQEAREIHDDVQADNGRGRSGTCPSDCSACDRITEILRDVANMAYWYGESTGDYAMNNVHGEEWFRDAVDSLQNDSIHR